VKLKNNNMSETKAAKNAISMQREIASNQQDNNNTFSTSNMVGPLFHNHYVNMETGLNGIENLITEILTEAEAIFPAGIENGEFRKVAIAASLFPHEIFAAAEIKFSAGSKRYPLETIWQYLGVRMKRANTVGKIQLKGTEDQERDCDRPRSKWYLVAK
jgi:hypothetical protein